jgi:hypothetical protein
MESNSTATPPAEASAQVEELDVRLAAFLEREDKRKAWKDFVIPVLSLLVALAGVLATAFVQIKSIDAQASLKQYEVTFIAKQKVYAEILSSMHTLYITSSPENKEEMLRALDKLNAEMFAAQPLLPLAEQQAIYDQVQLFINLCLNRFQSLKSGAPESEQSVAAFLAQRDLIRRRLNDGLFGPASR